MTSDVYQTLAKLSDSVLSLVQSLFGLVISFLAMIGLFSLLYWALINHPSNGCSTPLYSPKPWTIPDKGIV